MADRLPPPLDRWNYLRYIKEKVKGKEWHAECPICGDSGHEWNSPSDTPDRFHMHIGGDAYGGARGKCRRCGYFAWAEDEEEDKKDYLTPEEIDKINKERELRRVHAKKERERLRQKIQRLQNESYWRGYHDAMDESQRALWRKEGIPDSLQDRLMLGYLPNKRIYCNGDYLSLPAMSIPYFKPGWDIINVQYRLVKPSDDPEYAFIDNDRYRFTSGLVAPTYVTDPDEEPKGKVIAVEGAKKAIVVYLHVVLMQNRPEFSVVAFPSKLPNERQVQYLENAEVVYLGLDPDANEVMQHNNQTYVERAISMIGPERTRVVDWPVKPDDLVNEYGSDGRTLLNIIEMSRMP